MNTFGDMETLVCISIALIVFLIFAVDLGYDSRPVDDARHWWPGTHNDDDAYPQHHA
jgi:hypothetical protein